MGRPVVHFEIIGNDAAALRSFYSNLFGWKIDASNPMGYGLVPRDGKSRPTAQASGVGSG